jgi:hypothetical protein
MRRASFWLVPSEPRLLTLTSVWQASQYPAPATVVGGEVKAGSSQCPELVAVNALASVVAIRAPGSPALSAYRPIRMLPLAELPR